MKIPVRKPVTLTQGYGSDQSLSTKTVPRAKWDAIVLVLSGVVLGIMALLAFALSGAGDPTYGWQLVHSPSDTVLNLISQDSRYRRFEFTTLPPPPFIVEAQSANTSVWGFEITNAHGKSLSLLIDTQQSSATTGSIHDWRPFIHVSPVSNTLALRVDADGRVGWRVNGEIAWSGLMGDRATVNLRLVMTHGTVSDQATIHVYAQ